MSLILEALRKSEAERQRGRAPGLFVEQQPARRRERRVPAWTWGVAALLVAMLLAWGGWQWQRPGVVIVTTAEPSADTVTEAQPTQIAEHVEPKPGKPGSLAPITLEPSAIQAAAAPASAIVEPAPAPVPSAAASPAAPDSTAPAFSEAMVKPAPINAPVTAPITATPSEPAPFLPGLEALPAADRSALPPLKLSMHVYADAPAQRFVILDGRRLGEGASPASGVVLEEIRRDGLVLSVNGQRLLLARP